VSTDERFVRSLTANRHDAETRAVYADWLEERGDVRGHYLRVQPLFEALSVDDAYWPAVGQMLQRMRAAIAPTWLAIVDPHGSLETQSVPRVMRACKCYRQSEEEAWRELSLHSEQQDSECDASRRLVDAIDAAAEDGREEFVPGRAMPPEQWAQIITLPPSISKLKHLRHLLLYGSALVRIPVEIGALTNLTQFTPYTSYRLHWFPYEIARCSQLRNSTVSTRALYGNYKDRRPFPRLRSRPSSPEIVNAAKLLGLEWPPRLQCSVCDASFEDRQEHRVWISLRVATDVLPLLVNACSRECVAALPTPAEGYVAAPHRGGLDLQQPPARL
jgi:uncharacterized protein (TIGR02996 family)